MIRVLKTTEYCCNFDNDSDTERFLELNPEAQELTESEISDLFGDNAHMVCPDNTTVDKKGVVTFTYVADNSHRIQQIRAELDALDLKTVRPLRAIQAATYTQEDHDMLAHIESKTLELRSELAELA